MIFFVTVNFPTHSSVISPTVRKTYLHFLQIPCLLNHCVLVPLKHLSLLTLVNVSMDNGIKPAAVMYVSWLARDIIILMDLLNPSDEANHSQSYTAGPTPRNCNENKDWKFIVKPLVGFYTQGSFMGPIAIRGIFCEFLLLFDFFDFFTFFTYILREYVKLRSLWS